MTSEPEVKVGAIVLAAGLSSRMGQPKLVMPYKDSTVLGTVLETLNSAGVSPLIIVTGGAREAVEQVINRMPFTVTIAANPNPADTEMMDSLRIGMDHLPENLDAFLVVLGDQPQIQLKIISRLIDDFRRTQSSLIIPSYQMRRGHPWLIGRGLWDGLKSMNRGQTMRDFLNHHSHLIHYMEVDTDSIMADLDTPEDYRRATGKVNEE